MRTGVLAVTCLLATSSLAFATETFTLYGTGFQSNGSPVAGTGADGNWILESAPTPSDGCNSPCVASVPTGSAPLVTKTGQFPFTGVSPAWVADSASSQWVSPFANQDSGDSDPYSTTVAYEYQTSFDLTGLDPSTATITGQWTADNYGYIVVNGVQVTTGTDGNIADVGGQFANFFDFTLNSSNANFVNGVNTLDFYVFNNSNGSPDVTGVNIDIESDFADPSTPEPASFALVGLGLVALRFVRRRS